MGLKRGYKQTEVGVIPKDWKVIPFSELLEFRNGVNADKEAYGKGIPFINVLEIITKGHLRASDIPGRVLLPKGIVDSYSIRHGDLVFNRTSETQEEVGLSAVYEDDVPVLFGGFVIRGRPKTETIDPAYSGYAFRAPSFRSQIIARGQGAIRANVGQADLRQVLAVLPPLPEQRAIAGALGDVDALLGALEKLIAKKRDLKQAAMQQLLTGQKRLPGFNGEWEVKTLGETCVFENGDRGTNYPSPASFAQSGIPFVNAGHLAEGRINRSVMDYITKESYARLGSGKFNSGDILFCLRGSLGKFGIVGPDFGEGAIASSLVIVRTKSGSLRSDYLSCYFGSQLCKRIIEKWAGGAAQPNLGAQDLARFLIPLPSLPEQTAIAEVLSDMDAEIATLEQRLVKTRALKQGMMQELLTGKTRLVDNLRSHEQERI
jgi:type I restriction enzyme, S subunit